MEDRPPVCADCPAYKHGRGFVRAVGPSNPRLIVLGQGPGRQEAIFGQPFIGPSGGKLDRWLARSTPWQRDQVYVTNTVWCWLPRDRPPTTSEQSYCRAHHWGQEFAERLQGGRVPVLALGVPAGRALLGPAYNERWFGSLERVPLPTTTGGES